MKLNDITDTLLELESTDPTQEEIIDKIDYLINTFFQNNFQLQDNLSQCP